jgi:hypothetical protein
MALFLADIGDEKMTWDLQVQQTGNQLVPRLIHSRVKTDRETSSIVLSISLD